jgi:PKD repeat protein
MAIVFRHSIPLNTLKKLNKALLLVVLVGLSGCEVASTVSLLAALGLAAGKDGECRATAPTINSATATSQNTLTNREVLFAAAAEDSCRLPLTYSWDFGDQTYSSGTTTSKTYLKAGTYSVTLTVTNRANLSATKTLLISVDWKFLEKLWTRRQGLLRDDQGSSISMTRAVTAAPAGGAYVLGDTNCGGCHNTTQQAFFESINVRGSNAYLSRFNADGTKSWTRLIGANLDAFDEFYDHLGTAIASTTTGDAVYVGGSTQGSNKFFDNIPTATPDGFVAKYSSDGTKSWSSLVSGTGTDGVSGMAIAPDGSLYVVGSSSSSTLNNQAGQGGLDAFLIKYSPSGSVLWSTLIGGAGTDSAAAVTIVDNDTIYVVGTTNSPVLQAQPSIGGNDAFITRISGAGVAQWTRVIGDAGEDFARAAAVGTDGNLYVVGDSTSPGQSPDIKVMKITSTGATTWTRTFGGTAVERGYGVISTANAIYVTGSTASSSFEGNTNSGGDTQAFITKFLPDGTKAQTQITGSSGEDNAFAISLSSDNGLFIAGHSSSETLDEQPRISRGTDGFITKYTP